jgi:kinesin family protein C2/C3
MAREVTATTEPKSRNIMFQKHKNSHDAMTLKQQAPFLETISGVTSNNTATMEDQAAEQSLFEKRLCEDSISIRILQEDHLHGTFSQLRNLQCVVLPADEVTTNTDGGAKPHSKTATNSWKHRMRRRSNSDAAAAVTKLSQQSRQRALAILEQDSATIRMIPLTDIRHVQKGKTTERAKRCAASSHCILSLILNTDSGDTTTTTTTTTISLDMEAPTRVDRDKFARAFATFLQVDVLEENGTCMDTTTILQAPNSTTHKTIRNGSIRSHNSQEPPQQKPTSSPTTATGGFSAPPVPRSYASGTAGCSTTNKSSTARTTGNSNSRADTNSSAGMPPREANKLVLTSSVVGKRAHHYHHGSNNDPTSSNNNNNNNNNTADNGTTNNDAADTTSIVSSQLSSMTGAYDHDMVEELHAALHDLRAQLDESRQEAARAVKVAEQAIQSAERSSSSNNANVAWQNTVTHKAAEAAAAAQKKSAQAMAKHRIAAEQYEQERRTSAFWKQQAEQKAQEAGALQTAAAAAQVGRAAAETALVCERRGAVVAYENLRAQWHAEREMQRELLEAACEKNRVLELELESTRRQLETRRQSDNLGEIVSPKAGAKKRLSFSRKKAIPESKLVLLAGASSSSATSGQVTARPVVTESTEQIAKLYAEAVAVRQRFERLRRTTADELHQMPVETKLWANQVLAALKVSNDETQTLRNHLSLESASRRLLLHEVQDLRGNIRVYVRPKPLTNDEKSLISTSSKETITIHREQIVSDLGPINFVVDQVFAPTVSQQEVYGEIEEVCLGVLEGFNVCVMAYGPTGCGKTHTLLGDVALVGEDQQQQHVEIHNYGIQLLAMQQLFSIAEHRADLYKDVFSITIVEVVNDRIADVLAGTSKAEAAGEIIFASSKSRKRQGAAEDDGSKSLSKLEIRTDVNGESVVQGLISVQVESFAEVCAIWKECFVLRASRIVDSGLDPDEYEAASNVMATLKVTSSNAATGLTSVGKIQFVDLAGSDLVQGPPSRDTPLSGIIQRNLTESILDGKTEYKFVNKTMDTLAEVITARGHYASSIPYRNSTLTHLLCDSLDHDAKVILIACISTKAEDIQETATTLRFAARSKQVWIGKATKHSLDGA